MARRRNLQTKKSRDQLRARLNRRLLQETLEPRALMDAAGPRLIAVNPDAGKLFSLVDVSQNRLQTAPTELTLRFDPGRTVDPQGGPDISSVLDTNTVPLGISVRYSTDALFTPSDPVLTPGFLGTDAQGRIVTFRFGESLQDGFYRIQVDSDLTNVAGLLATNQTVDFELALGARVRSVVPQPVRRAADGTLVQQKNQIEVYFNNDDLRADLATNPAFYRLILTQNTIRNTDDQVFLPTGVTYDAALDRAILTFGSDISALAGPTGSGIFRLRIGNLEPTPLPPLETAPVLDPGSSFTNALNIEPLFDTGQLIAVTTDGSQIVDGTTFSIRTQNGLLQQFYFDDLDKAGPPASATGNAISVSYRSGFDANNTPVGPASTALQIAQSVASTVNLFPALGVTASTNGNQVVFSGDAGITLALNAVGLQIATRGAVLREAINNANQRYALQYPGAPSLPGTREIYHAPALLARADQQDGIATLYYNFGSNYGAATSNAITPAQKQRVREAFAVLESKIGARFVESTNRGFQIVTGVINSFDQRVDTGALGPLLVTRVDDTNPTQGLLILDGAENWYDDGFGLSQDIARPSYFETALRGILNLLGVGDAFELPPGEVTAGAPVSDVTDLTNSNGIEALRFQNPVEPDYPGDNETARAQYLYRPESIDIDLYRFVVQQPGVLTAETFAQRLSEGSLLNTALTLYRTTQASLTTSFNTNSAVSLRLDAKPVATAGNSLRLSMVVDSSAAAATSVSVQSGGVTTITVTVKDPSTVTYAQIAAAINGNATAATLVSASTVQAIGVDPATVFLTGLINTTLSMSGGSSTQIARNDDAFGTDSLIEVELQPGVYYIGVSSAGNESFDPNTNNTGDGGTSQGTYDLRVGFRAEIDQAIRDVDGGLTNGTALDGDGDGTPGGAYDFWFRTAPTADTVGAPNPRTLFVDKAPVIPAGGNLLPVGSPQNPFTNVGTALAAAKPGDVVRVVGNAGADGNFATLTDNLAYEIGNGGLGNAALTDGTTLDVPKGVTVMIDAGAIFKLGNARIGVGTSDGASANADRSGGALQVLGTPFLSNAAGAALTTKASLLATFGSTAGVSLKLDAKTAGTAGNQITLQLVVDPLSPSPIPLATVSPTNPNAIIVTMRDPSIVSFQSLIDLINNTPVTSALVQASSVVNPTTVNPSTTFLTTVIATTVPVSLSGGLDQIQGWSYFTSYDDESIGRDTNSLNTTPSRGGWGGIEFQNDIDLAKRRESLEREGIFLNYVNHADIRYGGGKVSTGGTPRTIRPVQMVDARPTVSHNRITLSDDAAIGASPDSFKENNFNSPEYALPGSTANQRYPFTSDYKRIGPDIEGNTIVNNSLNGMFIEIQTNALSPTRTLTTSGRWDDSDIVHILSENLEIQGQPGGPLLYETAPVVSTIVQANIPGSLPVGTYRYRLTFVTASGDESPASSGTTARTLIVPGGIRLSNLPVAASGFIGRNLYRSSTTGDGPWTLVAELDADSTLYNDAGATAGGLLRRNTPIVGQISRLGLNNGTLPQGSYAYRFTFVDAFGVESEASLPTLALSITGNPTPTNAAGQGTIRLSNLPQIPAGSTLNVYRANSGGTGAFVLAGNVASGVTTFDDIGGNLGLTLATSKTGTLLQKPTGRLSIDAGTIVKLKGGRIETSFGGDFYAEAVEGREVIFTSQLDDRYGRGVTFDTTDDGITTSPQRGDWGGLIFGQTSDGGLDHTFVNFAGGQTSLGGGFAGFNAVEIHQADVRIANSVFENNDDGLGGNQGTQPGTSSDPATRLGRGFNSASTIFIRGAQPVIVGNVIKNSAGAAISVNANALTEKLVADTGRANGTIQAISGADDNRGPLIRGNRLGGDDINGLDVRSETLTTHSVWDDADITHVVQGEIIVPDQRIYGGLTIASRASQNMVVKLQGTTAGFTSLGRPLDIDDRIGGAINVVGQPGFPVIITSLKDDSVGAGFDANGQAMLDTDGNGGAAVAGDWRSIRFDVYTHDRNVALAYEQERGDTDIPGSNDTAARAQLMGKLAKSELASDENRRLGFQIQGVLAAPADVDVYRVDGIAGTEVWFDIDRTSTGLDTVIELIDENGTVLAISDNSYYEALDPAVRVPLISTTVANSLAKTQGALGDVYSLNAKDAGMRVVLPGTAGVESRYFLRVRSSNIDVDPASASANRAALLETTEAALRSGKSSGAYQLNVRIREQDEVPGASIYSADIRFATTGIEIFGGPAHSQLTGETAETTNNQGVDTNNSIGAATQLGNLMNTDRAAISTRGSILNPNAPTVAQRGRDVDFYQFFIDYNSLPTRTDIIDASTTNEVDSLFVPIVLDVDYADGLGRANTGIAIYNALGELIAIGTDSNVVDDQPNPLANTDMANFAAGSAGQKDAYIGPIQLIVDSQNALNPTYTAAVYSIASMPAPLDQFINPNSTNPNVRLIPNDAVRRITEDDFRNDANTTNVVPRQTFFADVRYTADRPVVKNPFVDTEYSGVIEYDLSDLTLYVSRDLGLSGNNQSSLISVNPFTGARLDLLGQWGQPVGDIASRGDGELFSYSFGPAAGGRNAGNVGNFLNIEPGLTGDLSTNFGDDSMNVLEIDPASNANPPAWRTDDNAWMNYYAMTFVGGDTSVSDTDRFFAVGNREFGVGNRVIFSSNIMYSMQATTGNATNRGNANANADRNFSPNGNNISNLTAGPATQNFELGIIDTTRGEAPFNPGVPLPELLQFNERTITGIAQDPLNQSVFYVVDDEGGLYRIQTQTTDVNQNGFIDPDEVAFQTPENIADPAYPSTFNRGYGRVYNTTFLGTVTNTNFGAPEDLQGLTFGPRNVRDQALRNTLFSVSQDGTMYAFDKLGRAAPVFSGGRSQIDIDTPGSGINGLTFGTTERNLWHTTSDRGRDNNADNVGHGLFDTPTETRARAGSVGGTSFYFGNEVDANEDNNRLENDPAAQGRLATGGAKGTLMTKSLDLSNYAPGDKPTLYFNYYLETEGRDFILGAQLARDTFRVYASGDDGQWILLTTNNSFRDSLNEDEFDFHTANETIIQETFDNRNQWRQARADLSPLAGSENVRIRFDFNSRGSNDFRDVPDLVELVAVSAKKLSDGEQFTLTDNESFINFGVQRQRTFEIERGSILTMPSGDAIAPNELLTLNYTDSTGNLIVTTVQFVTVPGSAAIGNLELVYAATDTAGQVAQKLHTLLRGLTEPLSAGVDGAKVQVGIFKPVSATINAMPANMLVTQSLAIPPVTSIQDGDFFDVSFNGFVGRVEITTDNIPNHVGSFPIFINPATATLETLTTALQQNLGTSVFRSFSGNSAVLADGISIVATGGLFSVSQDSISLPPATQIADGEFLDLTLNGANVRFEFDTDNVQNDPSAILITFDPTTDTASTLAQALQVADLIGIIRNISGGNLLLNSAASPAVTIVANPANVQIRGSAGVLPGNEPVYVLPGMTATQVADQVAAAMARAYGGTTESYRRIFERLQLPLFTVDDAGPFTFASGALQGDEFGAGFSFRGSDGFTGAINNQAELNNNVEGVYIDDIMIGFAERGELVLNAPANNANFIDNPLVVGVRRGGAPNVEISPQPELSNETITGGYQFEIRTASNYGVPWEPRNIVPALGLDNSGSIYGSQLGRSIDTNDRLSTATSLVISEPSDYRNGDTFTISDGVNTITFEIVDQNNPAAAASQGNVEIALDLTSETANTLAAKIRDAINAQFTQKALDVRARSSDSSEVGPTGSNRIDLFGATVLFNATPGQNLFIDMITNEQLTPADPFRPTTTDSIARAVVTGYQSGARDTLTAVGRLGDKPLLDRFTSTLTSTLDDTDYLRIHLNAGESIDIDVDARSAVPFQAGVTPIMTVFDAAGNQLANNLTLFGITQADAPGESSVGDGFLTFVAPAEGDYVISLSINQLTNPQGGVGNFVFFNIEDYITDYNLTVRPTGFIARDTTAIDLHRDNGDENRFRDQGQLIIDSATIRNSSGPGITVSPGARDLSGLIPNAGNFARPGSPRQLNNLNNDRLAPGPVLSNNLLVNNAGGGIVVSGNAGSDGTNLFARIVNNTVYGLNRNTVGIDVRAGASPTVLNNILSNNSVGIRVALASTTTVLGSNLYGGNTTAVQNVALGTFDINLDANSSLPQQIFVAPGSNFIPAAGSYAIDSAQDSQGDRQALVQSVKDPMGIAGSPILAPDTDVLGQTRADETATQTPPGLGGTVFKDRGAVERADKIGPAAIIVTPADNDAQLLDIDPAATRILFKSPTGSGLRQFQIQLFDGAGTGPDASTVVSGALVLLENGRRLVSGVDYTFAYSAGSRTVLLTPAAGLWAPYAEYEIILNNGNASSFFAVGDPVIRDLTGIPLQANRATSETRYTIVIDSRPPQVFNDTFSGLEDGPAITGNVFASNPLSANTPDFDPDGGQLTITTPVTNVTLFDPVRVGANNLPVVAGTLTLQSNGNLVFNPAPDYFTLPNNPLTFTYSAIDPDGAPSVQGNLSGVSTLGPATVTIIVNPVNDRPSNNPDGPIEMLEDEANFLIPVSTLFANDFPGPLEQNQVFSIAPGTLAALNDNTVQAPISVTLVDVGGQQFVRVTPQQHSNGIAKFVYRVRDDGGTQNGGIDEAAVSTTVTLQIRPVNDAPVPDESAHQASVPAFNEDNSITISIATILGDDNPAPNRVAEKAIDELPPAQSAQSLRLDGVDVRSENGGTVTLDRNAGVIRYTPPQNFFGTDAIFYTISDFLLLNNGQTGLPDNYVRNSSGALVNVPASLTARGRITLTINPVNDPPVFTARTFQTLEDTTLTVNNLLGTLSAKPGPNNETEPMVLTKTTVLSAKGGAVTLTPTPSGNDYNFSYAPVANFFGDDTVVLNLSDVPGGNLTAQQVPLTLSITVLPVNDAPFVTGDTVHILEDSVADILPTLVTGNDRVDNFASSPGAQENQNVAGNPPQNGLVVVNAVSAQTNQPGTFVNVTSNGTIRVTPPSNYYTRDRLGQRIAPPLEIIYTVSDNGSSFIESPIGSGSFRLVSDAKQTSGTITVDIWPVNDAPVAKTHTFLDVREDTPYQIGANQLLLQLSDLSLTPPRNRPDATKDSAGPLEDVGPDGIFTVSDNNALTQLLSLIEPDPLLPNTLLISTTAGGSVEFDLTPGAEKVIYTPPTDFASASATSLTDSVIYRIADNGFSYQFISGGTATTNINDLQLINSDVLTATGTLTFSVNPINDPPQFSIANPILDVREDEDRASVGAVSGQPGVLSIPNFITNIRPGPVSAGDEVTQNVFFKVAVTNPGLFTSTNGVPDVSILPNGTLQARLAPNVNSLIVNAQTLIAVTAFDDAVKVNGVVDESSTGRSTVQTFTVNVTPVNDAPEFTVPAGIAPNAVLVNGGQAPTGPFSITVNEDSNLHEIPVATNIRPGPLAAGGLTVSDERTQNVDMVARLIDPTQSGLFELAPTVSSDGVLRFSANPNVSTQKGGPVLVELRAVDNGLSSSPNVNATTPITITINILEINDPPVPANDPVPDAVSLYRTTEDNVLLINTPGVLQGDSDIEGAALSVVGLGSTGGLTGLSSVLGASITLGADGSVRYDASRLTQVQALTTNQTLTDTFTYRITDGQTVSPTLGTVTITVTGVNDVPVINLSNLRAAGDRPTVIDLMGNSVDVDTPIDPSSIRVEIEPSRGSIRIQSDGKIVYTPISGFRGVDQFTVSIADTLGGRSPAATITLNITDIPQGVPDSAKTFRNNPNPIRINVLANDIPSFTALDQSSVTVVVDPLHGAFSVNSDGSINYIPAANYQGTDEFFYTVRDQGIGGQPSDPTRVIIDIAGSLAQNPANNTDVNISGETSPIDALLVINHLNSGGDPSVPVLAQQGIVSLVTGPFFDVDGNNAVEPIDALLVINVLNRRPAGEPRGEPSGVFNLINHDEAIEAISEDQGLPIPGNFQSDWVPDSDSWMIAFDALEDDDEENTSDEDSGWSYLV